MFESLISRDILLSPHLQQSKDFIHLLSISVRERDQLKSSNHRRDCLLLQSDFKSPTRSFTNMRKQRSNRDEHREESDVVEVHQPNGREDLERHVLLTKLEEI